MRDCGLSGARRPAVPAPACLEDTPTPDLTAPPLPSAPPTANDRLGRLTVLGAALGRVASGLVVAPTVAALRALAGAARGPDHRPAADAGREQERLLQLALAAADAGVWSAEPTTGAFFADARARALHGLSPDVPLTHEAALAAVVPEDRPRVEAVLQHTLATGAPFRVELRPLLPSGETRWLLSQAELWPDAEPPRLVGLVQDITARKQHEAALQESEARFRTMADSTPVMIWSTDAAGRIAFVNRAYCAFFGVTEADVRRAGWQPLVHPDDAAAYVDAFFTALHAGTPFHAAARVRHADGRWRWVESFGAPPLGPDGAVLGMVGSSPDITERQEADARFRGLFAGIADAILIADAEGRYLDANPAAEALLGYSRDELLTRRVADVVARTPEWTAAEYARYRSDGAWRGELALQRKDGTTVPVEALATVVELPTGPMYLAALRDLSERTRAEAERTALLDTLAHDVKNPLTAVKGQAQLLQRQLRRGGIDPARQAAGLQAITAAVEQAIALLDELLDAARLQSGEPLELRPEPLDLVALAHAAVAAAQATTERHVLRLAATVPSLVGTWDALRLRRVFDNLLGNAIKYSPDGGEIGVGVAAEAGPGGTPWAVVTVVDHGVGIPAADLERVFERWTRARNVAGRIAGSGIGLSGAKQIVEQHGGTIAVQSVEGTGSVFTLRLPSELPSDAAS